MTSTPEYPPEQAPVPQGYYQQPHVYQQPSQDYQPPPTYAYPPPDQYQQQYPNQNISNQPPVHFQGGMSGVPPDNMLHQSLIQNDPPVQGYVIDPNWQPAQMDANGSYDRYGIERKVITVDQWNVVTADQSDYSQYWTEPEAFEPEKISSNMSNEKKWNNFCCFVSFWVTFGVIIIFLIVESTMDDRDDTMFAMSQPERIDVKPFDPNQNPDIVMNATSNSYNGCIIAPRLCTRYLGNYYDYGTGVCYTDFADCTYRGECFVDTSNYCPSSLGYVRYINPYNIKCYSDYFDCEDENLYSSGGGETEFDDSTDFLMQLIPLILGISVGIAILLNVAHLLYAMFFPTFYIKFGIWAVIGFSAIMCCLPLAWGMWEALILAAVVLLIGMCCYWCIKSRIPESAAVLAVTCKVIFNYPSIILITIVTDLLEIASAVIIILGIYFTLMKQIHFMIILVFIFSYYWFFYTFKYVSFMTAAGTMSTYYFLNGTDMMPEHPVFASYRRAMTTSFGSAAFAAFICAIFDMLDWVLKHSPKRSCITCICVCIVRCILKCLEAIFKYVSYYALIYCATFGVPFGEGCRRFLELRCKKYLDVLIDGYIIGTTITINYYIFTLLSLVLGLLFGFIITTNWTVGCMMMIFTWLFFMSFFSVLVLPLSVYPDTMLVCFAECPDRLSVTDHATYELMSAKYTHDLADTGDGCCSKNEGKMGA